MAVHQLGGRTYFPVIGTSIRVHNIVFLVSGNYAACGFQIQLVRKTMQYLVQVYLPSCMFVVVSWVSFLIKPEVVPGRMALLVTLFLVLINIFNSVRSAEPFIVHKLKRFSVPLAVLRHFRASASKSCL